MSDTGTCRCGHELASAYYQFTGECLTCEVERERETAWHAEMLAHHETTRTGGADGR